MKILLITGDDDFAAATFEEDMSISQAVQKINAGRDLGEGYDGKILEFGEVDPEFIDFIKNDIMDYDDSKHKNFYVIPE